MLGSFRHLASSWVFKVLLVVLVISFAVWGIGDVFRAGGPSNTVAEVGDFEITAPEVEREYRTAAARIRQQLGDQVDLSGALGQALMGDALQSLITRRLLDAHADQLGITVDDATLAEIVRSDPSFAQAGQFDRSAFDMFLRANGFSEAAYFDLLRQDVTRQYLVNAVVGAEEPPDPLTQKLAAYRSEQRRGRALLVEADAIEVPAPDRDGLETYLAAHASAFSAPEMRAVALVVLDPAALAGEIAIAEADLRAAYEARLETLRQPERRSAIQILASDRATIDAARARLAEGASFADLGDEMRDEGVSVSELGPATADQLPGEISTAVFALAEGEVSQPVETAFGWHLFRLSAVEPETTPSFEEVRDQLESDLIRARAEAELPELANALDDALAAGEDLMEAASRLGLQSYTLEIDRGGRSAEGATLPEPALDETMLSEIFAAALDEESLVLSGGDGRYFAFEVTDVRPARTRALDEVESAVADAWRAEQRHAAAAERGRELRQQAADGRELGDLAASEDALRLIDIDPVRRDGSPTSPLLNGATVAALFETAPDEVAADVVEAPGGAAIVETTEILPAEAPETAGVTRELRGAMQNELLAAYEQALRQRFSVKLDNAGLASLASSLTP